MPNRFFFAGTSIVAPGILVRSDIGAQKVLSLLDFGTLAFVGSSDGGVPVVAGGQPYVFPDLGSARRVLRGGNLYNAIAAAAAVGGASGFIAVVAGTKTQSTLNVAGTGGASATFTSGDYGAWTTGIKIQIVPGTQGSTFALIVQYPDALSGQVYTIGGKGTNLDNFPTFSAMRAAVIADPVITPPTALNLPALIVMTVGTDGAPAAVGPSALAGGTGGGSDSLVFGDVTPAVDSLNNVAYDIGHLVKVYDAPSQAYATAQADASQPYCLLRRWIHQITATGAAPNQSKAVNSAAVAAALTTAATNLKSKRASVIAQQIQVLDPASGTFSLQDAAPYICGLAALLGSTGPNGPATPLTNKALALAQAVDYPVLRTTGDLDAALTAGGWVLEASGPIGFQTVRTVQSLTTAPLDPQKGTPWDYGEFSITRVSDALLANMKAAVEASDPVIIGSGNDGRTMLAILADCRDVLALALDRRWITFYDPKSIMIGPFGTSGTQDVLLYSAAPTRPLNHLGIAQTLLPYVTSVTLQAAA